MAADSGQFLITDPTYLKAWNPEDLKAQPRNLKRARNEPPPEDLPYNLGGAFAATASCDGAASLAKYTGIAVKTGEGAGVYPVYVEYNSYGEIEKVVIKFLPEEPEPEPYIPPAEVVGEDPPILSNSTEIIPKQGMLGRFKR